MAFTMFQSFPVLLLLLISLRSLFPFVEGEDERYRILNLTSTVPSNCASSNDGAHNISMGLFHRTNPCSGLSRNFSRPSIHETLLHDKSRIHALHKKISGVVRTTSTDSPGYLYGSEYVVVVGLGTPKVEQVVSFDTGSSLTWVQCSPCRHCTHQNGPRFHPSSSSTYRSEPCDGRVCRLPTPYDEKGCNLRRKCGYVVDYGDKSHSDGELGSDVLTLSADLTLSRFVFGCGFNQSGSYDNAAGMMGLARSSMSIVFQTNHVFGGVFSYCLPASSNTSGHLTFGASEGATYQYVPILTNFSYFYYVNFTGISVSGSKLAIPEATLTVNGTFMDSGTTLTYIPFPAYVAVRDAFARAMATKNYWPIKANDLSNMTCYNTTGLSQNDIPAITLHISGVPIELSPQGVFWEYEEGLSCLAFTVDEDLTTDGNIIGYVNQRQLEIVHDIPNSRIGFGKGTCR